MFPVGLKKRGSSYLRMKNLFNGKTLLSFSRDVFCWSNVAYLYEFTSLSAHYGYRATGVAQIKRKKYGGS